METRSASSPTRSVASQASTFGKRPSAPWKRSTFGSSVKSSKLVVLRTTGASLAPKRSVGLAGDGSARRALGVQRDRAAQAVGAGRDDGPARLDERAQRDADAGRQPARVAGDQDAVVARELRAALERQRQVGRDVIALAVAVQPAQQLALLLREAHRQAVAGHDPHRAHGHAEVERVGRAVAVVVGRVAPLPGDVGQHDEHAARLGARAGDRLARLHREDDAGGARRGVARSRRRPPTCRRAPRTPPWSSSWAWSSARGSRGRRRAGRSSCSAAGGRRPGSRRGRAPWRASPAPGRRGSGRSRRRGRASVPRVRIGRPLRSSGTPVPMLPAASRHSGTTT